MPPVDPARWRELSPYLDEALDVPVDDRASWLAALSARDTVLAADLQALLEEHTAADEQKFLAGAVTTPLHTGRSSTLVGQVVGAYRLVSLIGQGGMGSVWLARRSDVASGAVRGIDRSQATATIAATSSMTCTAMPARNST